jgi:hypothetical protein
MAAILNPELSSGTRIGSNGIVFLDNREGPTADGRQSADRPSRAVPEFRSRAREIGKGDRRIAAISSIVPLAVATAKKVSPDRVLDLPEHC